MHEHVLIMHELAQPPYFASDDASLVDFDVVHGFLTTSYWSPGIPRELVERAAQHSMCFGVYMGSHDGEHEQVGFARVVSDRATYAYIADVFVLEAHRGRGLSKLLMRCIMSHPELQGLRRWMLMTRDAHGLYTQFGVGPLADPTRAMARTIANAYLQKG